MSPLLGGATARAPRRLVRRLASEHHETPAGEETVKKKEGKEQKLKLVTASDRRIIRLAASATKRSRKWEEARRNAAFGPHCCEHCHAEPCGSLWPDAACCHRCTHLPMDRWKLTHVLWYRKKPYYVMEVAARRPGAPTEEERKAGEADAEVEEDPEERWGVARRQKVGTISDAVYYRWDGVCQWVRRARVHYFLGQRVSVAEFMRALPNEAEKALYVPRERPPNPFEESIAERPADEIGVPFSDRVEEPPPMERGDGAYHKHLFAFVEDGKEGSDGPGK